MRVLHVGCSRSPLPEWFPDGAIETRLDVDPDVQPDIVASMTDLGEIGQYESVFASHCLEHLAPHEVPIALSEMRRVLVDGGSAILYVPDLEGLTPTQEVLYEVTLGPITAHDLFYGHADSVKKNPYMAHKCGFTAETLDRALKDAGFSRTKTIRHSHWNLMGVGIK